MPPGSLEVAVLTPDRAPTPGDFSSLGGPIRTGLEGCGLAAADTAAVLEKIAEGSAPKDVSSQIAAGLMLSKRSAKGRERILTTVRRRYLENPGKLPGPSSVACALSALKVPAARNQLLLPYALLADRGLREVVLGYVDERRSAGPRLTKAEVVAELERLLVASGQRVWSPSLRTRWAEGVLSVLRDVGALGNGRQREQFLPYAVRPEAFGFHLWGLYDAGHRGPSLLAPAFWCLLLLRGDEARPAAREVADRGWWRFTSVGGVDELRPVHDSLSDWIANALG